MKTETENEGSGVYGEGIPVEIDFNAPEKVFYGSHTISNARRIEPQVSMGWNEFPEDTKERVKQEIAKQKADWDNFEKEYKRKFNPNKEQVEAQSSHIHSLITGIVIGFAAGGGSVLLAFWIFA